MKRQLKPLDIKPGELDTRIDADGVERWADTGKPVSRGNAFTEAFGDQRVNTTKMSQNARNSMGSSRYTSSKAAQGRSIGKIEGISKRDTGLISKHMDDPYTQANWATVNKNVASKGPK